MTAHPESPYQGQKISLLTKHGKELVIGSELSQANCTLVHVHDFDTDLLGNFTRDIPRSGSQLEAARKKAQIGMELAKLPIGIANEGAFSEDPFMGVIPWNYELIVLIDSTRDIEIVAYADSKAQHASALISNWQELEEQLAKFGFPEHYLVVKPDGSDSKQSITGISSLKCLKDSYEWARERSSSGKIWIENDLRAFANPTRMQNIQKAAHQLVQKMHSLCPKCQCPGFWITRAIDGLPCSVCDTPTKQTIAKVWQCLQCRFEKEEHVSSDLKADPKYCDYCNP